MEYFYDEANRVTFKDGQKRVGILYDADGNRVRKRVSSGGQPEEITTFFLIDTLNPTGYAQVLEELEYVDEVLTPIKRYTYGLDRISQRDEEGIVRYYGYDGLGSVRYLTDSGGGISDIYYYDAFGNLLESVGAGTDNHYLYAGEQWDEDLGLYYNRARYLDPSIGRFWTMDEFEGVNRTPLSLHKYLYAHADPVNNTDPSGYAISAVGQLGTIGAMNTLASIKVTTATYVAGALVGDYFTRHQLFLFHVTDKTIARIAKRYNNGAFRVPASSKSMFFATTSTHAASMLMYGVGYLALISIGLFEKATTAGIKALARGLGIPFQALPPDLQKPANSPVVILTGKRGSITGRLFFRGGIRVQGKGYVPFVYSTFTTAPGETVRPENYKLIPSVE